MHHVYARCKCTFSISKDIVCACVRVYIMFNEICINEEMLPKYTYFKIHDPAAHKYNSTLEYRRDLVKRRITLCKNNINTLNLEDAFT